MFVRRIGPHHVRLGRIGIGGSWIAQRLAWRAKEHDVRSRDDPVAVGILNRCIRTAIAGSTKLAGRADIPAQHVCEPDLVRRRLMMHERMDELHAVLVGAHSIRSHNQAGETVRSLPNGPHASIRFGANDRCILRNRFGARRQRLPDIDFVGQRRRLLRVCIDGNNDRRDYASRDGCKYRRKVGLHVMLRLLREGCGMEGPFAGALRQRSSHFPGLYLEHKCSGVHETGSTSHIV
jgi:hypothetical protein